MPPVLRSPPTRFCVWLGVFCVTSSDFASKIARILGDLAEQAGNRQADTDGIEFDDERAR
jgi:hypothetical protein